MNQKHRQHLKNTSNNSENNLKNICVLKVAKKLGVDHTVHYLHCVKDLVRATRNKYTVRSRLSSLGKNPTVGKIRSKLSKEKGLYIIRVKGHVLLMDSEGKTIVDTSPRKRDKRKSNSKQIESYGKKV